jgi:small subunit ribosomal protein S16
MAVKLRLTRTGANKDVSYRVVAADSRSPRDGRCIEILGWYDPKQRGRNFKLKLDRIDYWLSQGAQPSDTVNSLVKAARKAPDDPAPVVDLPVAEEVVDEVVKEAEPVEEVVETESVEETPAEASEEAETVEDESKTVAD